MTEDPIIEPKKRKWSLYIVTLCLFFISLAIFLLWLFFWRFEESTKDAYVHGNMIVIQSQIPGSVSTISVDDTEIVEEGRALVTLDSIDQELTFEKSKNALASTVRGVAQLYENVGILKGEMEMRKAQLAKSSEDYKHRKALVNEGGVSLEDYQHSEAAFIASFANLLSTKHKLRAALAQTENTTFMNHPLIKGAKDRVRESFVNLKRCTINAPAKGMVTMKKTQVGESITTQSPLMTLVPLDQIWVDANFKENQLRHVRLSQPVTLTSDIYGSDVIFHGEVIGISAATGSVLSVLPPQNATGNWIKIVQRLPVRIRLNPKEIAEYPLRLGLSMNVKVDIHKQSGLLIPKTPPEGPQYQTDVFKNQEMGTTEIISEIIKANSTFSFKVGDDGSSRK